MATRKPRHSKGSRITANGATLNDSEWDNTHRGDDSDTTCFEDAGFETGIIGIEVCEFNFGGDWDAGNNKLDNPPALYVRSDFPSLRFYENLVDNVFWHFTVARILSSRNSARIRDKVLFSNSGKSNGSFTKPTGSV